MSSCERRAVAFDCPTARHFGVGAGPKAKLAVCHCSTTHSMHIYIYHYTPSLDQKVGGINHLAELAHPQYHR